MELQVLFPPSCDGQGTLPNLAIHRCRVDRGRNPYTCPSEVVAASLIVRGQFQLLESTLAQEPLQLRTAFPNLDKVAKLLGSDKDVSPLLISRMVRVDGLGSKNKASGLADSELYLARLLGFRAWFASYEMM